MITKTDVVGIFKMLAAFFPQSAKNYEKTDAVSVNAWYEMVKDIPKALLYAAIKTHAATHTFAPSIAEIRAEALKITRPDLHIDPADAWDMVIRVVRGGSRKADILSLPAPVRETAKSIGWWDLGHSENPDTVRAQFMRMFDTRMKKDRETELVPEQVRTLSTSNRLSLDAGGDD